MRQYLRYTQLVILSLLGACKAYDAKLLDSPSRTSAIAAACERSASSGGVERCNGVDDDCDGVLDEAAIDCQGTAHGTGRCDINVMCVVDVCQDGYGDCNGSFSDGCEQALTSCNSCEGTCGAAGGGAQALTAGAGNGAGKPAADSDLDAGIVCLPDGDCTAPAPVPTEPESPPPSEPPPSEPPPTEPTQPTQPTTPEPQQPPATNPDPCSDPSKAAQCACVASAPTGQGEACDRCACGSCSDDLDACRATANGNWNVLCGALVQCYGSKIQVGCSGDRDCYDACSDQYTAAAPLGLLCVNTDSPCGRLNHLRETCYATTCAAVCKR